MSDHSQPSRTRAWALVGPAAIVLGIAASAFGQGAGAAGTMPPPAGTQPIGSASGSGSTAPPTSASVAPPAPPSPSAPRAQATPVGLPSETLSPSPAPPPALGFSAASGHLIVSADRLFGVWAWSASSSVDVDRSHTDDVSNGTVVNVLWSDAAATVYEVPRLALDGLFGPMTFGGSVGYLSASGSGKSTRSTIGSPSMPTETERELPKFWAFAVTPRIGAVATFGERVALWVRGGVTYYHSTTEFTIQDTSTMPATSFTRTATTNLTALTLDPELVVLAAPHFGFMLGAVADIGLGGSYKSEESATPSGTLPALSWDEKVTSYGLSVGVLGLF